MMPVLKMDLQGNTIGEGLPTDGEWNSSVSKSKTKTKVRVVYEVVNEIV